MLFAGLCAAFVVALAGCGAATAPPNGALVFAASCGGCHSLGGENSRRGQGGDLLPYHMSEADMIGFVRQMPAPRWLSDAEVRAVAEYVLARQAGARAPG
ncbi:MAG: hypothetical protein DLM63_09210 [Solirubrobacterales bacterium]|nr:MAG: hypothetical protein DLM63_09210 [Solirubrobacterales bacterium]